MILIPKKLPIVSIFLSKKKEKNEYTVKEDFKCCNLEHAKRFYHPRMSSPYLKTLFGVDLKRVTVNIPETGEIIHDSGILNICAENIW